VRRPRPAGTVAADRVRGAGAAAAREPGGAGGTGDDRPEGAGEGPGRPLPHGPGTGRRPGAVPAGRVDPGEAAVAPPAGPEVDAAASDRRVVGGRGRGARVGRDRGGLDGEQRGDRPGEETDRGRAQGRDGREE